METSDSNDSKDNQQHQGKPNVSQDIRVRDELAVSYFTMVPNMVIENDLSCQAFRLYVILKKIAGENGSCWQNQESLCKACKISRNTLVNAKRELVKQNLIRIELTTFNNHPAHLISIINIWDVNEASYRKTDAVNIKVDNLSGQSKIDTDVGLKEVPTSVQNRYCNNIPINNNPNNIYSEIFEYWNSLKIKVHQKFTPEIKTAIKASLANHTLEDIKQAFGNYAQVVNDTSDQYYFTYRWTLKDFLKRGLEKFLDGEIARQNYQNRQASNQAEPQNLPKSGVHRKYEEVN